MKKKAWAKKITEACIAAGTYREYFESVITTLAEILERRDAAKEYFKKSGGEMLVEHTNKGGATYMEQNPALRLINDLDRDALAYWRDLGLTPAGLKKINEAAMKGKKKTGLGDLVKDLGG